LLDVAGRAHRYFLDIMSQPDTCSLT
jgi:hypothetical protein